MREFHSSFSLKEMLRAIIFNWDVVVADTEPIHMAVLQHVTSALLRSGWKKLSVYSRGVMRRFEACFVDNPCHAT